MMKQQYRRYPHRINKAQLIRQQYNLKALAASNTYS